MLVRGGASVMVGGSVIKHVICGVDMFWWDREHLGKTQDSKKTSFFV
jgi:hypothetical protein